MYTSMSLCATTPQQASLAGMQEDGQAGLQELGGNATLLFLPDAGGQRGAAGLPGEAQT